MKSGRQEESEYAAFLSRVYSLLSEFDSEQLYRFRTRKPGLGPELVRVVDALARFRETWVEGHALTSPVQSGTPDLAISFEEAALIDDLFRSTEVFPSNADLTNFVHASLGIGVMGRNYSRSMLAQRVARQLSKLPADKHKEFLELLKDLRKKAIRGEGSADSFLRQWTRVIKGED